MSVELSQIPSTSPTQSKTPKKGSPKKREPASAPQLRAKKQEKEEAVSSSSDVQISQPAFHSTQKELSDEEPLPKYLKSDLKQSGKVKKRVLLEHHYTNSKGYLVTEKRFGYVEEQSTLSENNTPKHFQDSKVKKDKKASTQQSLTSFFKKT